LDADFLIPPYRDGLTTQRIGFDKFKEIWLNPIFSAFLNLAIHEAVYRELVGTAPQTYINTKLDSNPPGILIHRDSSLNEVEVIFKSLFLFAFY